MAKRKAPTNIPANSARLVTKGSNLRLEQPISARKSRSTKTHVAVEINPVGGFVGFLRDYAIVGLSIGFIIGNQMSSLVKILVASFIDPITHLLFGTSLSNQAFKITFHGRVASFGWGAFAYGLIELLILLIFIYVVIRGFGLHKLEPTKPKK